LIKAVLPSALGALYIVTDGVLDKDGHWFVICHCRMSPTTICGLGRPSRRPAESSSGSATTVPVPPFCVPCDGSIGVFAWDPIGQQAYRLADTVEEFWAGWRTAAIST
jgi:hypothetical protein